jgi:hypothetical protein
LLLGHPENLLALPLVQPEGAHAVGLVASVRDPLTPMTQALIAFAEKVDLAAEINQRVAELWERRTDTPQ